MTDKQRCSWAHSNDEMIAYHDTEWGRPVHDDHVLFEMLNLEGAQAGLSWLTILKRRQAYRIAFDNFNAQIMTNYSEAKIAELQHDASIIRNRLKIKAFVKNAHAFLMITKQSSFDAYVWQWNPNGTPFTSRQSDQASAASVAMSEQLKKDGFTFVGPTICYAYMQSMGMVNDHEKQCFLYLD